MGSPLHGPIDFGRIRTSAGPARGGTERGGLEARPNASEGHDGTRTAHGDERRPRTPDQAGVLPAGQCGRRM